MVPPFTSNHDPYLLGTVVFLMVVSKDINDLLKKRCTFWRSRGCRTVFVREQFAGFASYLCALNFEQKKMRFKEVEVVNYCFMKCFHFRYSFLEHPARFLNLCNVIFFFQGSDHPPVSLLVGGQILANSVFKDFYSEVSH